MRIATTLAAALVAASAVPVLSAAEGSEDELQRLAETVEALTDEVRRLREERAAAASAVPEPVPEVEPPPSPTPPSADLEAGSAPSVGERVGTAIDGVFDGVAPADDELVVSAHRRSRSRLRSPFTLEVVEAAEVRELGHPSDLRDRLVNRPGLAFRSSGFGGDASISLRGTSTHDTRVLVDGIPLHDPTATQGQTVVEYLPTAGFERVEVLKGAQSGLYGSRAVGGVVDITTIRPSEVLSGHARVEAGSMQTVALDAAASGPVPWLDGLGFAIAIDGVRSEGMSKQVTEPLYDYEPGLPPEPLTHSGWQVWRRSFERDFRRQNDWFALRTATIPAGDDDGHEEDGFQRGSIAARLEYGHGPWQVWAAFNGVLAETEYDGFSPVDFLADGDDDRSETRYRQWRLAGGARIDLDDNLALNLDLAHGRSHRHQEHVDTFDVNRDFDGTDSYASLSAIWDGIDGLEVSAGIDAELAQGNFATGNGSGEIITYWEYENGETWGFWPWYPFDRIAAITDYEIVANDVQKAYLYWDQSRPVSEDDLTLGAWVEAVVSGDDFEFSLAGRHDRHQRAGDATTFRAGGAYFFFDRRIKLKASVGTGFRAPSLFEQFSQYGDADLEAQESVSYEAGLELRPWPWMTFSSTYYRTDYQQFIEFDFGAGGYRNIDGNSRVSGWEHEVRIHPEHGEWELRAYVNPQWSHQGRDLGNERRLPLVSDRLAGAEATVRRWDAWLTVGVRHVGERDKPSFEDIVVPTPIGDIGIPTVLDAYTVVYAAAGWQFMPGFEVYARGENLTDEDYEEVPGYTTVRPSVWVGLEAGF